MSRLKPLATLGRRARVPGRLGSLAAAVLLAGCADTNAPLPEPVEVLLAVNRESNSLSVVPVESPESGIEIPLGGLGAAPTSVAARGLFALVPLGPGDAVAVVDVRAGEVQRLVPLPGSGATGAAILNDSIAYVAGPDGDVVRRLNYLTGESAPVEVGRHPQEVVFARGRVFVVNGNLGAAGEPRGESWITVIDPVANTRAEGVDSIPLTGGGNARWGTVGADGLLYVVVAGRADVSEGRLSIVDPLERLELASFAGLGRAPGPVATDGGTRVLVSSAVEGLLAFDTDSNEVVRGQGEGVPVPDNTGVAVDSRGRVYALEAGPCGPVGLGRAHVLTADLDEIRTIPLGRCPVAALTTSYPPE